MKIVIVGSGNREENLALTLTRNGHQVESVPSDAGMPWSDSSDPAEIDAQIYIIGPNILSDNDIASKLRKLGRSVWIESDDQTKVI